MASPSLDCEVNHDAFDNGNVIGYKTECSETVERDETKPQKMPSKTISRRSLDLTISFAKDQWFLIVMGILIVVASQAPVPLSQQKTKTNVINYLAVSLIFFLNGCAIPSRDFLENLKRWRVHIFVQLQSFVLASAVGFGVMAATGSNAQFFDQELLVGVIVLGCLPTAIAFNTLITRKADGNTALSLTQSALGNILGPFLSPVLVRMYTSVHAWYTTGLPSDQDGYRDLYARVFKQLGLSVFVPLAAGQITLALCPNITRTALYKYKLIKLPSLALLTLIWSTYDSAFASHAFAPLPASNIVFTISILAALYLVWAGLAFVLSLTWLAPENVVAVVFVVATKTPAIGVPLTGVLFAGLEEERLDRMRVATVVFQALQALLSGVLCVPLRRWRGRMERRSGTGR
ncbi:sodium bile acid symporter family protein [Pseudovirgaria hyperparasitica]|uniref:Sodium bile acid symporter family protein n=1 Tax=Pseudovirgaria hyperparasitica TaxID=470096 RepID=A0A6A6W4M5_9PEZI|nr:sodium bile acid symporter family protein [Pseudovirgaria hyperparasitica]KAF2756001.1 sodium bile acid symporter family protein [Pseudovirgaria hyperparasitica]